LFVEWPACVALCRDGDAPAFPREGVRQEAASKIRHCRLRSRLDQLTVSSEKIGPLGISTLVFRDLNKRRALNGRHVHRLALLRRDVRQSRRSRLGTSLLWSSFANGPQS